MTEEPRQKRRYTPRQTKAPIVLPPPPSAPSAQAEIDKQLQALIAQKPAIALSISQAQAQLTLHQDHYNRIGQQIQELIALLAQLGGTRAPVSALPLQPQTPIAWDPNAPIPAGVGSIPANPKNPTPNNGNAVDLIASESGFK